MRLTKNLFLSMVFPRLESLCRLLQVPAGRWPFPSLSLQSIYSCLDPYPAVIFQCLCPFLLGKHRSHDSCQSFDSRKVPCNAISTGSAFRGCSHSFMFRPLYLLDLLIALTSEFSSGQQDLIHHAELSWLPALSSGITI